MNKRLLIAQGGGPTAVINQTLVGAVFEAQRQGFSEIYGARHGVRGIIERQLIDLGRETPTRLERVAYTPSSALGSTRDKPDAAYCARILEVLKEKQIDHFFYIGGNDSSDTVRLVSEAAEQSGYPLCALHLPKTVDNDLVGNDHTPGYASAARYITQTLMGVDLDNRALPGVYLAVIMGRHAGFLTAAAAMARHYPDDGPHLLYLPERTFDMDRFLADVDGVNTRLGRCVIALSEGIHDASGEPIVSRLIQAEKDAHGNVQLSGTGALADLLSTTLRDRLGLKRVRGDTLGYPQRSFFGCYSEVDAQEAREVGEYAVQCAMAGQRAQSIALQRVGEYAVNYTLIPLTTVAAQTRVVADEHITSAGNDVTPAFCQWLRPLLGSELPVPGRFL